MKKFFAFFLSLILFISSLPLGSCPVNAGVRTPSDSLRSASGASSNSLQSVSDAPYDSLQSVSGASLLSLPEHGTYSAALIFTWADGCGSGEHSSLLSSLSAEISISYDDDYFTILDYCGSSDKLLELADELTASGQLLCIEEDSELTLTGISNDYFSDSQWSLNNTGSYSHIESSSTGIISSTADIDIDVPEGWAAYVKDTRLKNTVIVAVIDTGIDYLHPELEKSMWENPGEIPDNGIDDDHNGYTDDVYGWDFYNGDSTVCHYSYSEVYEAELSSPDDCDDHGTHVAGIIAARANNGIGIAGIASCADVKLMSLKIHGGPDRKGNISDAIRAIRYADMMGAKVCNISWGSYTESSALYSAILRSNMLFVCAAGNDGTDNDERPLYPASYTDLDNVLSVTYIDANGKLTYDSNYGLNTVMLAVPSTDIFSTIVGTYASMSGSSMAAPHVSAIAALIFTYGDGLSAHAVKDLICSTVKPLDLLEGLVAYPGIPSLYRALEAINTLEYDYTAPEFTVSRSFDGENLVLTFETSDDLSGPGLIRYFIGKRTEGSFLNGSAGTAVAGNTLHLVKAGFYTFYLNDRAGNAVCRTILVADDLIAPVISNTGVDVSFDRSSITVNALVSDSGSGIRTVSYAKGKQSLAYFLNAGEPLTPDADGRVSFTADGEGTYTIYACDYRGNRTVSYCMAYIKGAETLTLRKTRKTLDMGDSYSLRPEISPARSTDKITFTSSDEAVATVNSEGRVTAISIGTAIITGVTSSGTAASCVITVR